MPMLAFITLKEKMRCPGPVVVEPGPAVVAGTVAPDASNCAQRYRSYDPASGTYLGFDGLRHPCP